MSIINTNVKSTIAQNALKANARALATSMERLSTGKRINAAADDAAGLSIAARMHSAALGTAQALRNVNNAQSMVQVADGAMAELAGMLQRIRELSVQAANDTLSMGDRGAIEQEMHAIRVEIGRVVSDTEFNTIKVLSNREPGMPVSVQRQLQLQVPPTTTTQLADAQTLINLTATNAIDSAPFVTTTERVTPETATIVRTPQELIRTTVVDFAPRWSADGTTVVFKSSRSVADQAYAVPAGGGAPAVYADPELTLAPRQTQSPDGRVRLVTSGGSLLLQHRASASASFATVRIFSNYSPAAGDPSPYAFSPIQNGNQAAFVYTDEQGNIRQVNVNTANGSSGSSIQLIHTDDRLDFDLDQINHTIRLSSTPNLVNMNTDRALFSVSKVNDNGTRLLAFWDGSGTPPAGGYYTVTGRDVQFFGDARIGAEAVDDAADHYRIALSSDGVISGNFFSVGLPSSAEIYNMDGSDGPRSLRISVGSKTVQRAELLASQPQPGESVNGVFVNEAARRVEFYGTFRPASGEEVVIRYRPDVGGLDGLAGFSITAGLDTYNLTESDPSLSRALRVFVGGQEVPYDASNTNGYSYNPSNGRILLSGDFRPDVHAGQSVRFDYKRDLSGSNTSAEVFGIPLPQLPVFYNLDPADPAAPRSLRVYRNNAVEVPWSASDGFQLASDGRTIELYGSFRPNASDTFSIYYLQTLDAQRQADGRVIIPLGAPAADYGVADPDVPDTFKVTVNGQTLAYDATQTNGFTYDAVNNRIEIFGDARPDVSRPVELGIATVDYVRLASGVSGGYTYTLALDPPAVAYGLGDASGPASIRVFKDGQAVPFDNQNGFSFDPATQRVSLHGGFRPTAADPAGAIQVAWVPASSLSAQIPADAIVASVLFNGAEVPPSPDGIAPGYRVDGASVSLVGEARPDAQANASYQLTVKHYNGLRSIDLRNAGITSDTSEIPPFVLREDNAVIQPASVVFSLDGQPVSTADFSLNGKRLSLDNPALIPKTGTLALAVAFDADYATGFKGLEFQALAGAHSGQFLDIRINSFDNMLLALSDWALSDADAATQVMTETDQALNFVLGERTRMGAIQNRLIAASNTLLTAGQNLSASMSRIQDTDYAAVTTELARAQIIDQSATAMLAQANQQPELVLELLRRQ